MTRFLGTPLKGEGFSSSSDEAFSAKVAADTQPRIRIDAGGRITWGGGSAAGDVYVYRYGDNVIKFVGNVAVDALFVDGIEVDTTGATLDQVLKYNGTKFAPGTNVATVASIDAIGDVVITSPATGSTLYFDGTNWIDSTTLIPNVSDTLVGRNTTDTLTNKTLTTPTINGPTITATGQTPVIHGILIPNTHGIYFEGATTDANQTFLYCVDPTADRTILLPNADGTIALSGSIALGTDTTGNYMSGISGTSPVSVAHTAGEGSSATVSLAASYGDTQNPYASKTANYVLAAPNGTAGVPTFRAIVAADIPTLNQNTTGTAATVTGAAQTAITSVGTLSSLAVTGGVTAASLTLSGNLIVNGSTTTVNSTVTTIDDPVITLGGDTAPSSDDNKDRGIEFRYHNGAAAKVGFFGYDDSTGRFVMIPDATNTSEVFAGTAGDIQATTFFGALSGNASTATTLQSSRTIELTGDVTGSASFDGSANASITATIAANSVALGTDTTGNYMVNVSAGTGITVSHTQGEGSTATVSLNAGLDTLTDVTITSATTNDFLKYNGSVWVNEPVDLGADTTGSYVQSLVAGTGVTITNNSGEGTTPTVAIGQAVGTTSNVTFNDVTVAGNLNVTGSTFGSATLNVDNYKITLNAAVTGAPTLNGEIEVNRGSSTDVRIRWNEASDLWEYTNDGTNYSRIGSALMTVSDAPPASPYTGDLWFESDSGITFVRYDSHWIEIGASGIGAVTSDTAPSSPANGQIWFESDTNQLKIYYSGTWIQVGGSDAVNVINAINAKGDLIVGTANDTVTRLGAGTNGNVLTANSSTASGLEWVSRAAIVDDFAVASIMGAY